MDGHGGYTYSSSYTKNKCEPPQPRAPTSRTLLNRHAGSTLEIYSPAALLLMSLSAHYKQIAQGVLSAESGTHKCKSAGKIPTHPSQTDLILASEIAPFYVFYLLPDTFFGKNFSRAILAGAREWNMKRNDVILGVLNFFGQQGVRSAWLVASPGHGSMV